MEYDPDEPNGAFTVHAREEGGFEVVSYRDRVIVATADEGSAQQYAVMLNEAFLAGYKTGFRAGRQR